MRWIPPCVLGGGAYGFEKGVEVSLLLSRLLSRQLLDSPMIPLRMVLGGSSIQNSCRQGS